MAEGLLGNILGKLAHRTKEQPKLTETPVKGGGTYGDRLSNLSATLNSGEPAATPAAEASQTDAQALEAVRNSIASDVAKDDQKPLADRARTGVKVGATIGLASIGVGVGAPMAGAAEAPQAPDQTQVVETNKPVVNIADKQSVTLADLGLDKPGDITIESKGDKVPSPVSTKPENLAAAPDATKVEPQIAPAAASTESTSPTSEKAETAENVASQEVYAPEVKMPSDISTKRVEGEWKVSSKTTKVTLADGSVLSYNEATKTFTNAAGETVESPQGIELVNSMSRYDALTQAKLASGEAVVAVVDGVSMVVDQNGNNIATGEAASSDPKTMATLRERFASGGGVKLTTETAENRTWSEKPSIDKEFRVDKLSPEEVAKLFDNTQEVANRLTLLKPVLGEDGSLIPGGSAAMHEWSTTNGENRVSIGVVNEAYNTEKGVQGGTKVILKVSGGASQELQALMLKLNTGVLRTHADGPHKGGMIVNDAGNLDQTGVSGAGSSFFNDAKVVRNGADAFIIFNSPKAEEGKVRVELCQADAGREGFVLGPKQAEGTDAFDWSKAEGAGLSVCVDYTLTGTQGEEARTSSSSARLLEVDTEKMPDKPELPRTGGNPLPLGEAAAALGATGGLSLTASEILKRRAGMKEPQTESGILRPNGDTYPAAFAESGFLRKMKVDATDKAGMERAYYKWMRTDKEGRAYAKNLLKEVTDALTASDEEDQDLPKAA